MQFNDWTILSLWGKVNGFSGNSAILTKNLCFKVCNFFTFNSRSILNRAWIYSRPNTKKQAQSFVLETKLTQFFKHKKAQPFTYRTKITPKNPTFKIDTRYTFRPLSLLNSHGHSVWLSEPRQPTQKATSFFSYNLHRET